MFPYHRLAVFVPFHSVFRNLPPYSVHGHNESSTLVYFVPRSLHFQFSTGFFHRRSGWLERSRLFLKCDGTRAETTFRISAKQSRPFKSAGASVDSTTGSRGVRRVLTTHFIRHFRLHFPSLASPCAITFQLDSTCRTRVSELCHNCLF